MARTRQRIVVWWYSSLVGDVVQLAGSVAAAIGYLAFRWAVHPRRMLATVRGNREMFARFDADYVRQDIKIAWMHFTDCGCPDIYYCPAADDIECPRHGGFDVCCDQPAKHTEVRSTALGESS